MDRRILPFSETIYCRLVAYREEAGDYTVYVFLNLLRREYVTVTKLPEWNLPYIKIGDEGFLKYMEAIAGEDTWYDHVNNVFVPYKYDGAYMLNWVKSPQKR